MNFSVVLAEYIELKGVRAITKHHELFGGGDQPEVVVDAIAKRIRLRQPDGALHPCFAVQTEEVINSNIGTARQCNVARGQRQIVLFEPSFDGEFVGLFTRVGDALAREIVVARIYQRHCACGAQRGAIEGNRANRNKVGGWRDARYVFDRCACRIYRGLIKIVARDQASFGALRASSVAARINQRSINYATVAACIVLARGTIGWPIAR